MKLSRLVVLIIVGCFSGVAVTAAADVAENKEFPHVVFDSTVYHFAPVVEGVSIIHEFNMKNSGRADLKIDKVKTG